MMFHNILGKYSSGALRGRLRLDESVADTTAAITKPAITGGMRLSATVATALFASMFGNSANATRPKTAGTKANRAMIIPQI